MGVEGEVRRRKDGVGESRGGVGTWGWSWGGRRKSGVSGGVEVGAD